MGYATDVGRAGRLARYELGWLAYGSLRGQVPGCRCVLVLCLEAAPACYG